MHSQQMNSQITPIPSQMPNNFPQQMVGFTPGMPNVRPDMPMQIPPPNPQANPTAQGVSLYVGNLDPEVNEQRLYEHFIQYGHIINTKVMRDSYNGESRGFGFVTFANITDALRAKSILNYTKILDREIRISLKRNPSELNQLANLFFKNLDPKTTSKKLEEECSKFGGIISCVVKIDDESQKPLGYGYVQFETQQSADECIQALHNNKMEEKLISVTSFLPKSKRQNPFAKSNLYIKNFPCTWDEQQVRGFIEKNFSLYGVISSCGVFEDKHMRKQYAFVAFDEQEAAQKALNELNDFEIEGTDCKLYVAYAQDKATRRRTLKSKHMKFKNETNLYVKSLKQNVDEKQLEKAFEKFGKVTSVCIKSHEPKVIAGTPSTEKAGVRLRFGFVNFGSSEEAKTAFTECKKDPSVNALLEQSLMGRSGEFVYYAQNKTVRQQYLRMQKKNMKTFKIIQDNVLQYYQLMKYFMPQNYRGNNRGNNRFNQRGRGGSNMRGGRGSQVGGGYNNRGFSHGGERYNNYNNRDNNRDNNRGGDRENHHHSQGQFHGNQSDSRNAMTPTPQPNMMFNQEAMQTGFNNMGMNNASNMGANMNNMQAQLLQQQMMQQQNGPQIQQNMMNQQQQNVQMQGIQKMTQPPIQERDCLWLKNNISEFELMENSDKKNILGNLMYPLVEKSVIIPEHVPKITGMLIDLEVLKVSEIVEIMENPEALKERIDEAIGIINESE